MIETEIAVTLSKGETNLPVRYSRGKVNATVDTLSPAFVIRKNRSTSPVTEYRVREDAIFGCLRAAGLVKLGYLSIFEAHRLGLTERV